MAKPPRRVPLQDRSRLRVARILAAAAELFVEDGYEATTTEAIAERAGTSIGSVYQFFPNKLALFDAIAAQHLEQVKTLYDQLVTSELHDVPWEELIDRVVDAFAMFHRGSTGFRAVVLNWKVSQEFLDAGDRLNRQLAARTELLLACQAKRLRKKDRPVVATIVVEVMSAMLLVAIRRDDETAHRLLAETKLLMRRYLAPYVH